MTPHRNLNILLRATGPLRVLLVRATIIMGVCAVAGCNGESTGSPSGIRLHVATTDTTVSGQKLIKFIASVTNLGPTDVTYRTSCGPYIWFSVYDELGNTVRLHSPLGGEVCPLGPSVLESWATARAELLFGQTWDADGNPVRPAAGQYTVYTRFVCTAAGSADAERADRKTVIDWE